jgi:hypothetical protein
MVLLKLHKEHENRRKKETTLMGSIEEAIEAGQGSGLYYEVIDLASGRIIDWNEVNIRPEEDWYYDESEMIWKRYSAENARELVSNPLMDWLLGRRKENTLRRLSY